jgi:hypothetical protein
LKSGLCSGSFRCTLPCHKAVMENSVTGTAFLLSRVYAAGWKRALALSARECEDLGAARIAALNPHTTEPERSRWNDGFSNAIPGYLPPLDVTQRPQAG